MADADFSGAVGAAEQLNIAALFLMVEVDQQGGIGKQGVPVLQQHIAAFQPAFAIVNE